MASPEWICWLLLVIYPNTLCAPISVVTDPEQQPDLFEGDIEGIDPSILSDVNALATSAANGILDEEARWKDGVIPYEISALYPPDKRSLILEAIDGYHQKTCIVFRPRASTDLDFIRITPGPSCSSNVGRSNGPQTVNLADPGCMVKGKIQHELMHAVGFYHEQSRTDRDDYVEINVDNISEATLKRNFAKYTDKEITAFGEPYDYGSIMHYGRTYFSIGKDDWTIRPRPPHENEEIGQRNELSPIDIRKINKMYKCTEKMAAVSTTPRTPSSSPLHILKSCKLFRTVTEEDTCSLVMFVMQLSQADFERLNSGVDCNKLNVGQRLCVAPK